MATKIRLARRGRKRKPIYNIVVADARAPRDGRFIEKIGLFNPNVHPPAVTLDTERALTWLLTGAQPTETAKMILSKHGVMLKKHLQVGVRKGAITQDQADEKYQAWMEKHGPAVEMEAAQARKEKEAAAAQAKIAEAIKARAAAEEKRKQEEADAVKKAAEEAKAAAEAEAKEAEAVAAETAEPEAAEPAAEEAPAENTAAEKTEEKPAE
jgi:small subunit ribosomal protein S16